MSISFFRRIVKRDSPAKCCSVRQDLPRHCWLGRDVLLVHDEERNDDDTDYEWREDLSGYPREANTAECEADDGERRARDDDEVTTDDTQVSPESLKCWLATYNQSTRFSLATMEPSGVLTVKNSHTSVKATPVTGRFRSIQCDVNHTAFNVRALHLQNSHRHVAFSASAPPCHATISMKRITRIECHSRSAGQRPRQRPTSG